MQGEAKGKEMKGGRRGRLGGGRARGRVDGGGGGGDGWMVWHGSCRMCVVYGTPSVNYALGTARAERNEGKYIYICRVGGNEVGCRCYVFHAGTGTGRVCTQE